MRTASSSVRLLESEPSPAVTGRRLNLRASLWQPKEPVNAPACHLWLPVYVTAQAGISLNCSRKGRQARRFFGSKRRTENLSVYVDTFFGSSFVEAFSRQCSLNDSP